MPYNEYKDKDKFTKEIEKFLETAHKKQRYRTSPENNHHSLNAAYFVGETQYIEGIVCLLLENICLEQVSWQIQ